jgi:hypothetical protein
VWKTSKTQRADAATKRISRAKTQRRKDKTNCHFDRREKSVLDPSHWLGPSLGVLATWREQIPVFGGRWVVEKFAQAAKIFNNTNQFELTAKSKMRK